MSKILLIERRLNLPGTHSDWHPSRAVTPPPWLSQADPDGETAAWGHFAISELVLEKDRIVKMLPEFCTADWRTIAIELYGPGASSNPG